MQKHYLTSINASTCIGVHRPSRNERPILVVLQKSGATADKEQLFRLFEGRIATWWIPNDAIFVVQLPQVAAGKIHRAKIRDEIALKKGNQKPLLSA